METQKNTQMTAEKLSDGDLSEQIKEATKESHIRSENSELLLSFQNSTLTLPQYKLLLCSLYEIYVALEEELERNCEHPAVAPIYFPTELARLEAIEKDLEFFYGEDWRDEIVVPPATKRYCHRIRQLGKETPEYLVAHSYTRYLGDISGGQLLSRMAQKALGLKGKKGLAFFAFTNVSSPNLFKQLYRSRLNSIELTEEQRKGLLDEAAMTFEYNIQAFDDIQKLLRAVTENKLQMDSTHSTPVKTLQIPSNILRLVLGVFMALATVSIGIYAF